MSADVLRDLGPITFIGHSHIWALAEAIKPYPENVKIIDLWSIASPLARNEAEAITALHLEGTVVSIVGGNRHVGPVLYRHPRSFDFISPDLPEAPLEADAELVPYDAVRATLLDTVQHNLDLIGHLRTKSPALFMHLEPPPPWGDARRIEDFPAPLFVIPTDSFGARFLRLKMYRLSVGFDRAFCRDRGIEVVEVPEQAVDDEGFLRPEFSGDLMHANAAYGRLMVTKIARLIAARGAASAGG